MHPPPFTFLPSPSDPARPAITASVDLDSDVVHLSIQGSWNGLSSLEVSGAVDKCLAQQPTALLVDLRALDDPKADSAPVWKAAAHRTAQDDFPTPIALCLSASSPLAHRLHRSDAEDVLPIFSSPARAHIAVQPRTPWKDRIRIALPCHVDTPDLARTLVGTACEEWRLTQVVGEACQVVSELVVNALETGTDVELIVSRRRDGIHLAVYDREPHLPTLQSPPPGTPHGARGYGLHIVDAIATHWGATATRGGKLVWAYVALPVVGRPSSGIPWRHRTGDGFPETRRE